MNINLFVKVFWVITQSDNTPAIFLLLLLEGKNFF